MYYLGFFFFHLVIYSAIRLQFVLWNWKNLQNLSFLEYLTAFTHGLRFDLAALAMTTGIWLIGLVLFSEKRSLKLWYFLIFGAINFIFILTNCVDIELINFTARRFTKSSLFLVGEGGVSNLITPYLSLALFTLVICLVYVIALFWFYMKAPRNLNWLKKTITVFIILGVGVILSRGGFQHKPLTFVDSHLFSNSYANNLVLNSTFTFIKSYGKSPLERVHFYERDEMLKLLNTEKPSVFIAPTQNSKPNIVLVLVESLSKEYFELNSPEKTPYLRKLASQGFYFPHFYANSRRSIEGVASILAGIPSLMEEPFINSEFAANEFIGLGTKLQSLGYSTSFFHGAKNGSMHFDRFAKSAGINQYFGANEYPHPNDNDGVWGIYDEPFLNWTCQKLSEMKPPFFTTIFTLTSHQPFQIPKQYQQRFKEDPKSPILKAMEYTDFSLEQFMQCVKKTAWYNDTLFIFTADHTGPSLETNSEFTRLFQIPLIIYMQPHHELFKTFEKMDTKQLSQHIDLLPTILETLQIPEKQRNYLGRSLWQSGEKIVPLYSDNRYELLDSSIDEISAKPPTVLSEKLPEKLSATEQKRKDDKLKAVRQYFSEGLFDNRLYYPVR